MTLAHPPANGGDVVEIVCLVRRKFDVFDWMHVEEFLRGIPGKMWQVDATAEEEGFVVISPVKTERHLLRFSNRDWLRHGGVGWSPVDEAGENRVGFELSAANRACSVRASAAGRRPFAWNRHDPTHAASENLPCAW